MAEQPYFFVRFRTRAPGLGLLATACRTVVELTERAFAMALKFIPSRLIRSTSGTMLR